jgi:hypothetical protein
VQVLTLARLPSNRGNESLELEFIERRDQGPDAGADCRVRLVGSNWSYDDGPRPVRLDLGSVHLSLAAISSATSDLARWVNLPLEQLALEPLECQHQLALGPSCELWLRFGERADVISGRNPVLTAAFSVGSLSGELRFVTDQSCIAEFVADLQAAQRAVGHR